MKKTKRSCLIWYYMNRRLADKLLLAIILGIMVLCLYTLGSCSKEEETCKTCGIITNAPGASSSRSFCGTDSEISAEDARLKNECADLQAQYPQYTFDCGCN